jgi:hypothetical protein
VDWRAGRLGWAACAIIVGCGGATPAMTVDVPPTATDDGVQVDVADVPTTADVVMSSDNGVVDAGTPDAGTPDVGTPDVGTPDAGTPDAGTPDAGTPDAGTPDAGTPDVGTPDAGTPDVGTPDAGTPDVGTPDVGTPDVGTPDAGVQAPTASRRAGRFSTLGVRSWQNGAVRIVDDELEAGGRACSPVGGSMVCVSGGFLR